MKLRFFYLACISTAIFTGFGQNSITDFERNFKIGNNFYNVSSPTQKTDNEAIHYFQKVLDSKNIQASNAPKAVEASTKIGILHQTYTRFSEATRYYHQALDLHKKFKTHDTTAYLASMYLGMMYYYSNDFSNCYLYLNQAEKIYLKYNLPQSSESLFNTLGVLYFESGNYRQSINYFTKAQHIELKQTGKIENEALQSNIATALRNLGKNQEALEIYQRVLKQYPTENRIRINLATTYLALNQSEKVFEELKKIKQNNDIKNKMSYHNLHGRAYVLQKNYEKAVAEFNQSISIYTQSERVNKSGKNTEIGNSYKYLGDIAKEQKQWGKALNAYQKAIFHLDNYYKSDNIYTNPKDFSTNLNNILLFETLKAKGDCFKQMYLQKPTSRTLFNASIDTYESAFQLSKYLLNLYDNEEARLNLSEKIYPFFSDHIDLLVFGFEQFKEQNLLEKAFVLSEKSKSSVLAIDLNETALRENAQIPDSIILEEQFLNLTKSKLILSNNFNQNPKNESARQLNDIEVKISRLKAKMNEIQSKSESKEENVWNLEVLRSEFLESDRAIFSIYKINDSYQLFLLSKSGLKMHRIKNGKQIDFLIDLLNNKISSSLYGRTYSGQTQEKLLYEFFFSPFENELKSIKKLIIIPHFESVRLPFEILKTIDNQYVLSRFEISYQYSADILLNTKKQNYNLDEALIFAPFTESSSGNILPASLKEIQSLNGIKQISKSATKQAFLSDHKANSLIHLATHATADNTLPEKSYVSFYPTSKDTLLNRLYVDEIKLLDLRKVDLLFLSACETSSGKQVQNEGIMSLSRAFSLAGCSSIITSLWKAEDEATAYLSQRFYGYLDQNESVESALRKAKLDLINDPQMAQYHSPAYWSHLIMIGVPTQKSYLNYFFVLLGIFVLGISAFKFIQINRFIKPKS